jgi:ATP-dependent helicase/nuclease subunit A
MVTNQYARTFLGQQKDAVYSNNPAIAVTAGAGSGKTRSLVGRYLHLLERGYPIRSILAITFTEKAAREMRSRIRAALLPHPDPLPQEEGATNSLLPMGEGLGMRESIDSARIGTIHSLCAEILRLYPAEAGLDPAFDVLEEGLAAALKAEAIEAALAWATEDAESAALFGPLKESELRQVLGVLLERRLDIACLYTDDMDFVASNGKAPEEKIRVNLLNPRNLCSIFETALEDYLQSQFASLAWQEALTDLSTRSAQSPDDKLELARREVLARWDEVQSACATGKWDTLLVSLAALRKSIDTRGGRKEAWDGAELAAVRKSMAALKEHYEANLKLLAEKARFALDEQAAAHLPALLRLFNQVILEYQRRKDERQALDFDDLEGRAAQTLTENPAVRASLQAELRAVLVDEFQDTNQRQRQIVYALTGFSPLPKGEAPGARVVELFIVGDSKQSIYKFRGADVSVFRQAQRDIQASGGQRLDLDLTFRAHKELLETLNALLAPVLGETDDPARPWLVPFAPLHAHRQNPARETIQPPYVECHLGLGESAEDGRQVAAAALAGRLRELHQQEGFDWGEMALLFRASTHFPNYENALEAAGIPFVTVAGRGFYDRPEIRDLLNILAAIADPADDLALVGLLRSPAFAVPDAEIYQLRTSSLSLEDEPGILAALRGSPVASHARALAIIAELRALAGRAPAAAVLKRLLDLTGYRAILASVPNGARLIRNVEKLLADAHRSRLVSLPAFLAYVRTLRDVGLREGEAPADAQTSGAVQLMTVHKAKGLEFPLTVLADAAYEPRPRSAKAQVAGSGLLLDLKDGDFHPAAWQIAARLDDELEEAEDRRLLYVAATRAREKLLISGHVKAKKDGTLSIGGWLDKLGLEQIQMGDDLSAPRTIPLNQPGLGLTLYPVSTASGSDSPAPASTPPAISCPKPDLLEPIAPVNPIIDDKTRSRESDPPLRVWRIVPQTKRPHAPAWVIGKLVHEAVRRWRFPDDGFDDFLRPFALEAGLIGAEEIHIVVREARRLLERLRAHPLYAELNAAERHHEVPYYTPQGRGIIDLLYHFQNGWCIIDFKTDRLRSEAEARAAIRANRYDQQVAHYARALADQAGVQAKTRLVFLNLDHQLTIFDLEDVQ